MFRKLALVLIVIVGPAFGHGGGLDANRCHTNHKTGEYHCHRGSSSAAKAPPLQPVRSDQPAQAQPAQAQGPTCYTGPRGGTYTITPSGRKNYRGC